MKKTIAIISITLGLVMSIGGATASADSVGMHSDSTNISSGNTTPGDNGQGNPIKVHIPKKVVHKHKSHIVYAVGKKKLPQTGDSFNNSLTMVGILLLGSTLGFAYRFKSKIWG